MEDKKPCDDIFDGLAELLIKSDQIIHNVIHSTETWDITYGGYIYLIKAHDGEVDSIKRVRVESEDE